MSRFTDFKTRIAGKIVTYYCDKAYRKAVVQAEERHKREGEMIYVIDHFIEGQLLSCINRREFRFIKHMAQKLHKDVAYWSPEYGVDMLKEMCWYHTANGSEENALTPREAEIRRLAFIRAGLKKARLFK